MLSLRLGRLSSTSCCDGRLKIRRLTFYIIDKRCFNALPAAMRSQSGLFYNNQKILPVRTVSTQPQAEPAKELDPREASRRLIDSIPGNSFLTKTGTITVGAGLAAFLFSKEIIILNEESLVAFCFGATVYLLYRKLSKPVAELLDSRSEVRFCMDDSHDLIVLRRKLKPRSWLRRMPRRTVLL